MNRTRKIVISSMFAALTCVATMLIKIPSPLNGYINLGDSVVLLAGWLLSPIYGFLAAGLGAALADVFSGYGAYVPATFIIKGLMAAAACCSFRGLNKKIGRLPSGIISGALSEIIMIFGYFLFEGLMYGFVPSLVNIPANAVQGIFGIVIGNLLARVFSDNKIIVF